MTEDKELPLTSPLSTAYGGRTDASVSNRVRCRAGGTAGAKTEPWPCLLGGSRTTAHYIILTDEIRGPCSAAFLGKANKQVDRLTHTVGHRAGSEAWISARGKVQTMCHSAEP